VINLNHLVLQIDHVNLLYIKYLGRIHASHLPCGAGQMGRDPPKAARAGARAVPNPASGLPGRRDGRRRMTRWHIP